MVGVFMAINQSIGKGVKANKVDTKVVQAALNLVQLDKFELSKRLVVDGMAGKVTLSAIEQFQKVVVGMNDPDERVDPGGNTIKKLKSTIKKVLNEDSMMAIMAMGHAPTIKGYTQIFNSKLPVYEISSPLRVAHFLAQVGHESLSLIYTEELASGEAYEGRKDLGNIKKGDGVRFKGRGLIQLTGRANYSDYGNHACLDLLKKGNEQLIAITPQYALDVALWFWKNRKLNTYADKDDIRAIPRRVNGGYNGLEDRKEYLKRAKFFLL